MSKLISDVTEDHPGMRLRTIKYSDDPSAYIDETRQAVLLDNREETRKQFYHCGSEVWSLNKEEIDALLAGKTLARDINGGEYGCFLRYAP